MGTREVEYGSRIVARFVIGFALVVSGAWLTYGLGPALLVAGTVLILTSAFVVWDVGRF